MSFSIPSYDLMIAANRVPGLRRVQMRGYLPTLVANSAVTVRGTNSGTYTRLTTAVAFEAVSGSAADDTAGTGAQELIVELIDGTGALVTKTVATAGVTPVAIAGTYLFCNSITISKVGSGGTNAGQISVRTVSGAAVQKTITTNSEIGAAGVDGDFQYYVPLGYDAVLGSIHTTGLGITGNFTAQLMSWDAAKVMRYEASVKSSLATAGYNMAVQDISLDRGLFLPSRSYFELRAYPTAGAGGLVALAELILVKQDAF